MDTYKNKYRIHTTRFDGWDYTSEGSYFVTICTKDKQHFFGEIIQEKMLLNDCGKTVRKYWKNIPKKFPNIHIDYWVIMPNHIHGILCLKTNCRDVDLSRLNKKRGGMTKEQNPMFGTSLGKVIRWYKGRCTFECKKEQENFQWQERFYDRVIRNENELKRIREYIENNPLKWEIDRNNIENIYM